MTQPITQRRVKKEPILLPASEKIALLVVGLARTESARKMLQFYPPRLPIRPWGFSETPSSAHVVPDPASNEAADEALLETICDNVLRGTPAEERMLPRKRHKAAGAGSHTETESGESVNEEEEEGVGQANYLEAPVHFQSLREVIVTPR